MSSADRYSNPLTERYASQEMSYIFSANFKFGTWRRLWLTLAESEKELGLAIPDAAIEQLRANLDTVDLVRAAQLEKELRHDVMAHVHQLGEQAPAARAIIHLGATSAFVGDNTDLIQHREALTLIRRRLVGVIAELAAFARRYRDMPTLGFTHFQPAQPTTVGKRATLWIQDLLLDLEEVEFRLETLRFRGVRGTTGSQASFLDLFEGDHEKVETLNRMVAERMGIPRLLGVTGQTYTRKADYAPLSTLSGIAQSASKIAHDLRLLAHLREVEEPFEEHQIGSSAMPYKRNPMRSERITSLARHVITLVIDPAFTAATQWFERTLDDSANKRIAIPEAYLATDSILLLLHNVSSGLVVYPEMIRRHLEEELPFMATENLMMRSVKRGGDRQELHERVRQHALAAGARVKMEGLENDLLDRIAADPAFGVTRTELDEELRPELYIGRAPQQVDVFLSEWVEPVLQRYAEELEDRKAPELHV
ncbi:MAG: adenylosuccinate lyase [Gemmatimonadota bacterium]|jgi:adenylosuccinate lyase|nr:adenylosuccinate lyase [Gemmatimonadota bacterium]